jgi:transposase InsO family protein
VFIERLWRSLKYECVYLQAFETGSELRAGLGRWIAHYNERRQNGGITTTGYSLFKPKNCPNGRGHL